MADPPRYTDEDTGTTPRWVKMFGIVTVVLVLLLAGLMIFGGHGPGRHASSGDAVGHTPSYSGTEHSV